MVLVLGYPILYKLVLSYYESIYLKSRYGPPEKISDKEFSEILEIARQLPTEYAGLDHVLIQFRNSNSNLFTYEG